MGGEGELEIQCVRGRERAHGREHTGENGFAIHLLYTLRCRMEGHPKVMRRHPNQAL